MENVALLCPAPTKYLGNWAVLTRLSGVRPERNTGCSLTKNLKAKGTNKQYAARAPEWTGLCSLMEGELICSWIYSNNVMSPSDLRPGAEQVSIYRGGWKHPLLTKKLVPTEGGGLLLLSAGKM